MKPATVTDSLLHDLVVSALAEGTDQLAVAAAVTLDDRILLCGHDTNDFDQQWDLPGGAALPGETLTSALDRILACDYGLDTTEIHAYLGSYDRIHHGGPIRTFVFSASCADPLQICRHAWTAHCWADPASLPDQASQELARLADLATQAAAPPSGALPGRWQLTAALRACSKGMYCDQAATELLIQHGSWLRRDDFTARFILTGAGPASHIIATINWEEAITALDAGDLPCSSSFSPPSSAWPPASPPPHLSSCATPSPDSIRPTSTSSSTPSETLAGKTNRTHPESRRSPSSENRGFCPSRARKSATSAVSATTCACSASSCAW
jgi:ADP-ribose pyrophosphatase YjhB (NUDIX family)